MIKENDNHKLRFTIIILIAILLIILNNLIIYLIIKDQKKIDLEIPDISINTDEALVSWTNINNADGYNVFIDNKLYGNTDKNNIFIDLDDYNKSHIIQIESYSNDEKYNSSMSKPVLYQVKNRNTNILYSGLVDKNGIIVGTTYIDIFNNAFFELDFNFSGYYILQFKYLDSSTYIDEFKIVETSTNKEIRVSEIDDNWYKVYVDKIEKYLIEFRDLNNKCEKIQAFCTTYYETELFCELNLSLKPNQTEIIKVKYDEAKDIIFRTKEYNRGVYFQVYKTLGDYSSIGYGDNDHLAMIPKYNLSNSIRNEFYLLVQNVLKDAVEIIIENIDLYKTSINFDEIITVDEDYSVKVFKFTNNTSYLPIYIEYFDENNGWKNFYNTWFNDISNVHQLVKSNNTDSTLYVIEYLRPNETCYLVIVPYEDEIIGVDQFLVSKNKPYGW